MASATQPKRLLLIGGPFGERLPAAAVLAAVASGLRDAGLPEPDICQLPPGAEAGHVDARALLDGLGFDVRMRAARAVVIAVERLEERTLAGSVAFEIATRARQSGVPSYAVAAGNHLDDFDARILDLQVILEARSARALTAAGRTLASVV
jgi:hypothetical protein